MTEQRIDPNLHEYLPAFYRVIEDHVTAGFAVTINKHEFYETCKHLRVRHPNGLFSVLSGGIVENHYIFCMNNFREWFGRKAFLGEIEGVYEGAKPDFIFDERTEKKKIFEDFIAQPDSDFKNRFGNNLSFRDDKVVLPLQAADLIAWWLRDQAVSRPIDELIRDGIGVVNFPWKSFRSIPFEVMLFDKKSIVYLVAKQILFQQPQLAIYQDDMLIATSRRPESLQWAAG